MKKLLFIAVAILFSCSTVSAEERVIVHNALPQVAQKFIAKTYPSDKISIATEEKNFFDKDYKVILTSGVKIEFDAKGNWTEIDCRSNSEVPIAAVPSNVSKYVKSNFADSKITKIERDKSIIDVELNNGIELNFKGNKVTLD